MRQNLKRGKMKRLADVASALACAAVLSGCGGYEFEGKKALSREERRRAEAALAAERLIVETGNYSAEDGMVTLGGPDGRAVPESAAGNLEIPAKVKGLPVVQIGDMAFAGCAGLESVTMPGSVARIGRMAFMGCAGIRSVTIPAGTRTVGPGAFAECAGLRSFRVDPANWNFRAEDTFLFSGDGTVLVAAPGAVKSAIIPAGTRTVGDSSFRGCRALARVAMPPGVERIEGCAFMDCTALRSVELPRGLVEIGRSAFAGCGALSVLTVPAGVTEIGEGAFDGCGALAEVHVPKSFPAGLKSRFPRGCAFVEKD